MKKRRKKSARTAVRRRQEREAVNSLRRTLKKCPDLPLVEKAGGGEARRQLKAFRERYLVSQTWLASKLGCSVDTLSKWERRALGIRHPELLVLALKALAPEAERYVADRVEEKLKS